MSDDSNLAEKQDHEELGSALELLQKRYDVTDVGNPDTLCNTILQFVAEEKYDQATKSLRIFQKIKNDFPQFEGRSNRLFDHAVELIGAIRSKKKFPAMASLPTSKQQELEEILREHFADLKRTLTRVVSIDNDLRLQDARSTVWVLQTFVVCASVLLIFALIREALMTMGVPVEVILADIVNLFFTTTGL